MSITMHPNLLSTFDPSQLDVNAMRSHLDTLDTTTSNTPIAISLDIETSDTEISTVIHTLGAVAFNIITGEILDTLYLVIDFNEQLATRSQSESTLAWWRDQEVLFPKAFKDAFRLDMPRISLPLALTQFNDFVDRFYTKKHHANIFGNGCDFDNSSVLHAMKQHNIKPKWAFRGDQSLRTAVYLGRILLGYDPKRSLDNHGTLHHALDDAIHEAQYLCHIVGAFRSLMQLACDGEKQHG
jgi:hypothetical protein